MVNHSDDSVVLPEIDHISICTPSIKNSYCIIYSNYWCLKVIKWVHGNYFHILFLDSWGTILDFGYIWYMCNHIHQHIKCDVSGGGNLVDNYVTWLLFFLFFFFFFFFKAPKSSLTCSCFWSSILKNHFGEERNWWKKSSIKGFVPQLKALGDLLRHVTHGVLVQSVTILQPDIEG